MSIKIKFGRCFDHLVDYERWSNSIITHLVRIADQNSIDQFQNEVDTAVKNLLIPSDFGGWFLSDVIFIDSKMQDVHDAVCAVGLSQLSKTIDLWHKRVIESMLAVDLNMTVLCCGPGAVEDIVIPAQTFIKIFIEKYNINLKAAETIVPGSEVNNKEDVVALLWDAARQPGKGLKPFINSLPLRDKFDTISQELSKSSQQQVLGGAQTIMASALRQLGIKADVAWPYHSDKVANYAKTPLLREIKRVNFVNQDQYELHPFDSSNAMRPDRTSFILNISNGEEIGGKKAIGADRVIFRMRRYQKPGWKSGEIIINCHDMSVVHKPQSWHTHDWPSLPLLGYVEAGSTHGKNLIKFEAASDRSLKSLAHQYERFIWTGLQVLDDPGYSAEERHILSRELRRQLRILFNAGGKIYIEISGVPKHPEHIKKVISGNVHCIGINQTELTELTSSGSEFSNPVWAWPSPSQHPESLLTRYFRGVSFAKFMGTDVFVHGNDCSMFITRSDDKVRLERIVSVLLLASYSVISHLLDRASGAPSIKKPSIAEKGFMSLLQFAHDLSRTFNDESIVNEVIQQGYYKSKNPSHYSVVIVPVAWPLEVQHLNPTGAGDTIAGVVGALLPL